jgi:hypothetical protein
MVRDRLGVIAGPAIPEGRGPCSLTPRMICTSHTDFPVARWKRIWSANPSERLNKEVNRRTDVVSPAVC